MRIMNYIDNRYCLCSHKQCWQFALLAIAVFLPTHSVRTQARKCEREKRQWNAKFAVLPDGIMAGLASGIFSKRSLFLEGIQIPNASYAHSTDSPLNLLTIDIIASDIKRWSKYLHQYLLVGVLLLSYWCHQYKTDTILSKRWAANYDFRKPSPFGFFHVEKLNFAEFQQPTTIRA